MVAVAKKAALHGVWRSSVAYVLWEHGAKGSNPFTPTICGPLVKRSKTPPFHGGNRSSSLLGVTKLWGPLAQLVRAVGS